MLKSRRVVGEKCCGYHNNTSRSTPCLKCRNLLSLEDIRRRVGRDRGYGKTYTRKYSDLPYLVKDYPRPLPPVQKKSDIFDPTDYREIDTNVAETPDSKLSDFPTLVAHLTDQLHTDVEKVRAIFSWLSQHNVIDTEFTDVADPYTPRAYLKKIHEEHSVYTTLFTILCREAGIPCVILEGRAKAGAYEVGDIRTGYSTWNAVYVGEGWRFVHCNWAFISIVGQNTAGWVKVEEDGVNVHEEVVESKGEQRFQVKVKDSYFLMDPEDFIYYCRPKDDMWQLLTSPLSMKRFMALPFIRTAFAECGFSFKPGQKGTIKSAMGESDIVIMSKAWNGRLKYELFYKVNSGREFPDSTGADRYVAMVNRNGKGEFRFKVRFPIEGHYKLSIFRKKDHLFSWVCDFKLVCEQRQAHCNPLPETPAIGWGPGVVATEQGLYDISHGDGIIESRDGKHLEISFKTRGRQRVRPRLKHAQLPDNLIKHFMTYSTVGNCVNIKLRPDDGEYALIIDTYKEGAGKRNVLNYIVEAGVTIRRPEGFKENPTEKHVRIQLKEATKERRKEDIANGIKKFKKHGMEDKGHLTLAKQTLEKLEIKEKLHYALMRERTDELEKAIRRARTSGVADRVQMDVDKAESVLQGLLLRHSTPRPLSGVTHRNMSEIRSIRTLTPPLKEVFTAMFLLLGEKELHLQNSCYILGLLQRTGNDGLLARLGRLQAETIAPDVIQTAKSLLNKHSVGQIIKICPPVGKIYTKAAGLVAGFALVQPPSIILITTDRSDINNTCSTENLDSA